MNNLKRGLALFVSALLLAPLGASASDWGSYYSSSRSYEVTITNVSSTYFTPLLVVAHSSEISLFEAGTEANDQLAVLAEGGATQPYTDLLDTIPDLVGDYETTEGLLGPGQSVTVMLDTNRHLDRVSVAAMMLPTNDSFVGLNTVRAPRFMGQSIVRDAIGYDAGSEPNDELCANIPGPQCGGEGPSPDAGGEGTVRVSPGIHGEGDLLASAYDWRNPVARVKITRVSSN